MTNVTEDCGLGVSTRHEESKSRVRKRSERREICGQCSNPKGPVDVKVG